MSTFASYFMAIAPTIGVLFILWRVVKAMVEGDRRERIAHAQWERDHHQRDSSPDSPR